MNDPATTTSVFLAVSLLLVACRRDRVDRAEGDRDRSYYRYPRDGKSRVFKDVCQACPSMPHKKGITLERVSVKLSPVRNSP